MRSRGNRALATLAVGAVVTSLAACSSSDSASGGGVDLSDGLQIVTTIPQIADFTTELTRGLPVEVDVSSLIKPGDPVHGFEPTAADVMTLSEADIAIENGLGLEPWFDSMLSGSRFAGERFEAAPAQAPGDGAQADHAHSHSHSADEHAGHDHDHGEGHDHEHGGDHDHEGHDHEHGEGHDHEHGEGHDHVGHDHDGHDHDHDGRNPHAWTSPAGATGMVNQIGARLEALLPDHAATIHQNRDAYLERIGQLDTWIRDNINAVPKNERVLVTDHHALDEFAEQYDVHLVGSVISGWDDAAEPSAQELDQLIRDMKAANAKAIFTERDLSPSTVDMIARETGAQVFSGEDALYADTLGMPGTPEGTWLGAQVHNVRALMKAWNTEAKPLPDAVLAGGNS